MMSRTARTPARTELHTPDWPGATLAKVDEVTPTPPAYPFLLPALEAGELGRVGNYRVLKLLGQGGMGMVFAAEDIALHRSVALKMMNPALSLDPINGTQRFLREARALASINHRNLVSVHQAFQERGNVFLVMELLEGESLENWLHRSRRHTARDIARVGKEIADGLAVLHVAGLVHRDIKPANIWVESGGGHVKILDLGLVRLIHDDTQLTEVGMILGTPAYMSPEQVRARAVDHRSDLFSLGCVLYALCTGRQPFQADTPMAQAAALAADEPTPVHEVNPKIPQLLSELIAGLMAKNPDHRPDSAAEVAARLRAIAQGNVEIVVEAELIAQPEVVPEPTRSRLRKKSPKRRKSRLQLHLGKLIAAAVVLVVAIVLLVVVGRGKKPAIGVPEKAPEVTPVAAIAYLSDLPRAKEVNWPFRNPDPNRPKPPGVDGPVIVQNRTSPHGIFMHPPRPDAPPASITYKLGKAYSRFAVDVAINDSSHGTDTPVVFVVCADGRELWRSRSINKDDGDTCAIDVRGVDMLKIEVICNGDPRGAHAVWIEPRLTK